ncbi:hypothetical protein EIP86_008359 [Pleurotus ostreatoroseus]|nr:hypothetical protein EIP86_008359 [Pleurotus ostreatoroseus]
MKPAMVQDEEDDLAAEEENKIINEVLHRVLLGTHTSGQAQDYLQIAEVRLPKRPSPTNPSSNTADLDRADYDDERGELGGHTLSTQPRVSVTQRITHKGEVNRARYMPQNPDLLATKAVSGEIYVFDRTKFPSEPEKEFKPNMTLVGQRREGDVNSYTKEKTTIEPTTVFRGHTSVVGDVDWHSTQDYTFASVGDDKMLMIWDTRASNEPVTKVQAHDREILAVSYSPAKDYLLLTGSADHTIILHDLRAPAKKLHTFEGHTDEVLHVAWSPHNPTIFASASSDRRINVWDLSQIGVEQTPDDQEDGPPELLFVHGGHTARPTDFCWAPGEGENWTAASTSEDNIVMVWQPTMRIWAGDEIKIDPKELEDGDAMEGVESTAPPVGPSGTAEGTAA